MASRKRRPFLWLMRIVLLLGSLTILLLVIERAFLPWEQADPLCPQLLSQAHLDLAQKEPGELRLVVLGGPLAPDRPIPAWSFVHQLEQIIAKRSPLAH